jgi:hypothetical protein
LILPVEGEDLPGTINWDGQEAANGDGSVLDCDDDAMRMK